MESKNICVKCGNAPSVMCERCYEKYCDAKCQTDDWQKHRYICFKMPGLIPIKDFLNVSNESEESVVQPYCTEALAESVPKEKKIEVKSEKSDMWNKICIPPFDEYFDAVLVYIEPDDSTIVWVIESKNIGLLRELLLNINSHCKSSCSKEEVYVGAIVAAPFEGKFYRAEILDVTTKFVEIKLIDFGNKFKFLDINELHSPNSIMTNTNCYGFTIRLPKNCTPEDLNKTISIRINKSESNVYPFIVELKENTASIYLPIEIIKQNPEIYVKRFLKDANIAFVTLNQNLTSNEIDFDKLLDFEIVPNVFTIVAVHTENGWSCGYLLSYWKNPINAIVFIIDEATVKVSNKIKIIPKGSMENSNEIIVISSITSDEPLIEANFKDAEKLSLHITDIENDTHCKSLKCTLFADNKAIDKVEVSTLRGYLQKHNLNYWVEDNSADGDTVYITKIISHSELYISSIDARNYSDLISSIAVDCHPYKSVEIIRERDIVLGQFEESDVYFRGEVLDILSNGDKYKLLNIDTGDIIVVERNLLRKPNSFIRSLPVYLQKIELMFMASIKTDVENNKALHTLERMKIEKSPFIIKYNENANHVNLLSKHTKSSLSKYIMPMLFERYDDDGDIIEICDKTQKLRAPSSSKVKLEKEMINDINKIPDTTLNLSATSNKYFTHEDIVFTSLPIGQNVSVVILDSSSITNGYFMAAEVTALKKIKSKMSLLSKYAKEVVKKGYSPKRMEVCLAVFAEDGNWYRAVCLSVLQNKMYEILFIDFGNNAKISYDDIIPITEKFMFPCCTNMCFIATALTREQCNEFIKNCDDNPLVTCSFTAKDEGTYFATFENLEELTSLKSN